MLISLLHALCGAAVAVWAARHADALAWPALPWLAGLAGAFGLGMVGRRLARRALPGGPASLCWDGAAWQLRGERPLPLRRLIVSLDLGAWVLLQAVPADGGAPCWLVAGARSAGGAWHGLRVALQAHAGNPTPADKGAGGRR